MCRKTWGHHQFMRDRDGSSRFTRNICLNWSAFSLQACLYQLSGSWDFYIHFNLKELKHKQILKMFFISPPNSTSSFAAASWDVNDTSRLSELCKNELHCVFGDGSTDRQTAAAAGDQADSSWSAAVTSWWRSFLCLWPNWTSEDHFECDFSFMSLCHQITRLLSSDSLKKILPVVFLSTNMKLRENMDSSLSFLLSAQFLSFLLSSLTHLNTFRCSCGPARLSHGAAGLVA